MSELTLQLRAIADTLDKLEGFSRGEAWEAVYGALLKGNPTFADGTGKSTMQRAVDEIQRLYTFEATVIRHLREDSQHE